MLLILSLEIDDISRNIIQQSHIYKLCYKFYFMRLGRKILDTKQPAIGNLVRDQGQIMKLSQKKFAAQLGFTFPTINRA